MDFERRGKFKEVEKGKENILERGNSMNKDIDVRKGIESYFG